MRVLLRLADGEVDLEVAVHDPAATVADLAAVLPSGADPGAGLVIDGVVMAGPTPLACSGLRPGSEVSRPGATASVLAPLADHEVEVRVVGGLSAGARHALPPGRSLVGRGPASTVVLPSRTTSSRHATIEVRSPHEVLLADEGSTSGSWIDGRQVQGPQRLRPGALAALGASLVSVGGRAWCEPALLGPPRSDGSRPLHRPPPSAPRPPVNPVTPPGDGLPPAEAPRFSWAAALVPLAGGLVLARFVDPRLALFTLLGPAVLMGQWLEDRRRHRRRRADASTTRHADLARFVAALEVAAAAEGRRRSAIHPDPAALGREIDAVGSGLWSRRQGHPAFAEVTVGVGPALAWTPPTTAAAVGPAAEALAAVRLPHGGAATLPLASGRHLGIAGPRSAALPVARWVVLQLAAHHGPADLRIGVVCRSGGSQAWGWAAYLPHTAAPGGGDRRLLAAGSDAVGDLVDLVGGATGPHVVIVVDGERLVDGGGPAASLIEGSAATVTIGPSRRALPSRCTSVLELEGPDGWAQLTTGGAAPDVVLAAGVDHRRAASWARRLASLADPEAADATASPPQQVRLLDLLGLARPSPAELRRRWQEGRGAATPIGCAGGADGHQPVELDLVADGPHALVAGTTGAGKSELLRSLVAGLAASAPPDRLAMLLVDYKGGAAFAEAARLPHVVGVVTDLGAEEAARALHSLEAELRRREAVLAGLGLRDLAAHPAHRPGPVPPDLDPLPRLVVVVDELAALAAELPSFLEELVQLAARGRSLGLHLVLATQRPGSVVSAAVRTNCAIRCCLRVPDEADALDVVGSAAPAHLDRRQVGRAFLRRGAGDLVEVQVALVGGRQVVDPGPVTVRPADFGPAVTRPSTHAAVDSGDLAALVTACGEAVADAGLPAPRPIWLPPLPPQLSGSELPEHGDDLVVGLVDDPGRQRRLPLMWRPADGPLLALGRGDGPALALQAAARLAATRLDPGRLHVYGLDLAAQGLSSLGELPHVGAVLRPGEHERLHRLILRLADELALRQARAADGGSRAVGSPPPLVLLLIDGVAALRAALEGAGGLAALDALERVVVDGAALGLVVAVAADRLAAVPGAWGAAASCRLAFRGGDPLDLLALGAGRVDQTPWPVGRCIDLGSTLTAQVATGGWRPPKRLEPGDDRPGPPPVATLPRRIRLAEVLGRCPPQSTDDGLRLPLGIDGRRLDVAVAHLRPGQPFLICGPPGSGRTSALAAVGASAAHAGCQVAGADEGLTERLALWGAGADGRAGQPPLVVLVDDAERVADDQSALSELVAGRHRGVHLVATASLGAVRSAFGHWSAELRRAGTGLVLRPRTDLDADVLGIPLLPRWPVPLSAPGRGVLVSEGEACPVQVAMP